MTFHIVGLDLSLSATGVAVIRPHETPAVRVHLVTSSPKRDSAYPDHLDRLRALCRRIIDKATSTAEPGDQIVFVMEGPAFAATGAHQHTRAGLWWLIYHLLSKQGVFVIIEPSRLKRYVTGKGNAPKDLVFATMIRNFPGVALTDNNEADALGLAAMGARELGFPQEPSVQRVTPAALEGVDWPSFAKGPTPLPPSGGRTAGDSSHTTEEKK